MEEDIQERYRLIAGKNLVCRGIQERPSCRNIRLCSQADGGSDKLSSNVHNVGMTLRRSRPTRYPGIRLPVLFRGETSRAGRRSRGSSHGIRLRRDVGSQTDLCGKRVPAEESVRAWVKAHGRHLPSGAVCRSQIAFVPRLR